MGNKLRNLFAVAVAAMALILTPALVFADATPTLNQTVNTGSLSTNIYQSNGTTPVAAPAVNFSAVDRSFACQTTTATLGDTNDKVYVTNFAANSGWTLSIAATGGPTAAWSDGNGHSYKYNDATGSGCTNGQLTVNPAAGTITTDCSGVCTGVTVNKGASTTLDNGTSTNSATLMTTASGTAWRGYLTGVSLSQKIPASQESGSYSLGMTITAVSP